jgi:hypothetical protein
MTPAEAGARQSGSGQIESSGLADVRTKVLYGDPSRAGFYSIVWSGPAHTMIALIRIATIVWPRSYRARGVSATVIVSMKGS